MHQFLSTCLGALLLCSALPALAGGVESFAPTGEVKNVRQVQVRFGAQMVPFGDLRPADPFDVDCPQAGRGRWVDGTHWNYDFERDVAGGVECRFTLKPGLRDLAGQPVSGAPVYRFSSGGPAILEAIPYEGSQAIDERQVFILALDAPARDDSVVAHAYCRADGVHEKIGVRLLRGEERDQLLAQRRDFVERHLAQYFEARGLPWNGWPKPSAKRAATPLPALPPLPLAVLQCQRTLPAHTKVALVWGQGVAAASGVANAAAQTLSYVTRPDFTVKFSCERSNAKAQCIPFLPLRLTFSAPIKARDAQAISLSGGGKVYRALLDHENDKDKKPPEYVQSVTFAAPLPEQAKFLIALPPNLKDDAGRALLNQNRYPLAVGTDQQPPLVKFPASFGILEAGGDRLLPVTVRNVEATLAGKAAPADIRGQTLRLPDRQDQFIIDWLKRLSGGTYWRPDEQYGPDVGKSVLTGRGATRAFALPKPNGARAFEVIGIPLPKPGFYVVELASPKLGAALLAKPRTAYIHTATLVTNMAAHFKHGAQSSLVWVTSLDKGAPVPGAQVAVRDCAGKLLWQGATDSVGVARIGQELAAADCKGNANFFVSARSGADMTFTLSDWVGGIESWRFNLPTADLGEDNLLLSTVFDRTLLRAGETVHMKHFLRRHTAGGVALAPNGNAVAKADKLLITHQGSEQKYELALRWSGAGTADNDWPIPADARQGVYRVSMAGRDSGSFRVEAFRVPSMKALLQGPKTAQVQVDKVNLDLQLTYLSGGGAALAPVKLRTVLQDKNVSFPDYADFTFSNGDVKEGVRKDGAGSGEEEGEGEGEGAGADVGNGNGNGPARTQSLTLDRAGGARVTVDQLPALTLPRDLLAELAYQDANGETLSVSTRVALWPSKRVIGIKPDAWALGKNAFKFQVAVLDTDGKPVADAPVAVDFFQRKTYSHRRRLIGGFYAYENSSEVLKLGPACEGKTDARGLLLCEAKAPASGNLILRARTVDDEQRAAVANRDAWVAGDEDWWFNASDNDRIDVLPEKKQVEPGENAKLQVRMPFRAGTALVTVEREGILDTYVRQVSGREPVLEIPIKAGYAPNVYVSVLVVRGRVAGVRPTALVDLGKPAYKMGIAALRVGWRAHQLKVQLSTDREVYRPRAKAQVKVKVRRADGAALPPGAEVALVAVDAGLLELMPNDSWDLLDAMMRQRALQVETSTAQMQVIGKRHFGRKAFPHGGGGGKGASRELFDTLLFWKANVKLDANGEASLQVPLNDALTAFRIVAVASAGADLFGTGKAEIRSEQDLSLLSGLPPLVREGDTFRAGFTLRNTTARTLTLAVTASVQGQALARQSVTLDAGQARDVGWDYTVPAGTGELLWEVGASGAGIGASADIGDSLRVKQKVKAAVPLRTYQSTLLRIDPSQTMAVRMPLDALAGRGGVQTVLSAKLGQDLPGVREYMTAYPYTCFEQKTSRAIALGDAPAWRALAAQLPAYLDGDGLLKYFPNMERGSDSLTAYVLSATAEAGYPIPEQTRNRMEEALSNFVQGRVLRDSALPTADLAVRKLAALEALSRSAKVAPDALESITVEPALWPTSAVIDWSLILQRTPKLVRRDVLLAEAQQILRARLNFQGGTMGFSTEQRDNWWWLMVSGDVNANRLLLAVLDNPAWKDDIGRLVRGSLGR